MGEDGFFREFTLRICGSFDITEALWRCFLYVRSVLPADELILSVFDPAFGFLEIVTTAHEHGGTARGDKIPMDVERRMELEHIERYPRVRICNDALKDPIISRIALQYRWPDSSVIVGRLVIQESFIGSLIVRANGKDRYTEEHARLWSLVNEPAGIALANSRQYEELVRMKDLLADDNRYLQNELRKSWADKIVGADFGLRDVFEQVVKVAPLTSPVLLMGETGTGKEVIANAIHNLSPRNNGPLITVNCGAIPESLIDSELFGHEKGAFTGAMMERRGRFERAHNGTIFLDEVGELPPQAQVRLLRVLQEREIERVGGTSPIKVDIRIISATHRNLEKLVAEGSFRDDLYYRLGVFPVRIPPLRERRADIPALTEHFIEKKSREMGLRKLPRLGPGVIDRLMHYEWPGNVREVANLVERALIQSEGESLDFADLLPHGKEDEQREQQQESTGLTLEQMEMLHIRRILKMVQGRIEGKNGAALRLGVHPSTLRARMRKLGIPYGRKETSRS